MAQRGDSVSGGIPGGIWDRRRTMTQLLTRPSSKSEVPFPLSQVNGSMAFHRFSVDEYHRMADAGLLTESSRVELLAGWIVDKMTKHPPHSSALTVLNNWFGS